MYRNSKRQNTTMPFNLLELARYVLKANHERCRKSSSWPNFLKMRPGLATLELMEKIKNEDDMEINIQHTEESKKLYTSSLWAKIVDSIKKEDIKETVNLNIEEYTKSDTVLNKMTKEYVTDTNNQHTEEYSKSNDACTLLAETDKIKKVEVMETYIHDIDEYRRSDANSLVVGIINKMKKKDVMESNNQDTEEYITSDSNSLIVEDSFQPRLIKNMCPLPYTVSCTFENRKRIRRLVTNECRAVTNYVTEAHRSSTGPNNVSYKRAPKQAKVIAGPKIANERQAGLVQQRAKIAAKAAKRVANESPAERAARLKRQSEYRAKKLANETQVERRERLLKVAEYQTIRRDNETEEQKRERLLKLCAVYAARKRAQKKAV